MGSEKLMTNSQGLFVANMGRQKGVTSKQAETANFGLALDAAKNGLRIGYIYEPPLGGRVHTVRRVSVDLNRDLKEAINDGCPQTPNDYRVRKVGNLYPPTGKGTVERDYILLNNNCAGFDAALKWAKPYKLDPTDPREVFGVAEHKPQLYRELGMDRISLIATKECEFEGDRRAFYVWWDVSVRGADLLWVGAFDDTFGWFAFSRD